MTDVALGLGLPLLDTLGGHASIEPFVREGYEVILF